MNKLIIGTLVFLGLFLTSLSSWAKISLQIDRNNIRENETFQLTISVENPDTLAASQDLSFLPNEFQVLSSQRFQKSTVINGQFANRMGWSLQLVSAASGTFTLPSFTIGQESSEPFTVRVLPTLNELEDINPSSKIKLTATVSKEQVYVQEQIIFSIRIYSSVPTRRRSISPLQLADAVVHKLDDASEFQMVSNGVTYNVIEEKYVIFPQKSGELKIPPVQFRTNIVDTEASFGSLSRYRPIELHSQPFNIEVTPKPTNALSPWIPAKEIALEAIWQPANQSFEVGTPASLDFIIKGVALLPEQLPEVVFPQVDGLKIYRDKPNVQTRVNASGVTSYHLEKLAIIPSEAGNIAIPEIKLPYWNTETNQQAYAILPAISMEISPSQQSTSLPTVNQVADNSNLAANEATVAVTKSSNHNIWQILAIIFAALWVISSVLLWLKSKRRETTVASKNLEATESKKTHLEAIRTINTAQEMAPIVVSWLKQRSAGLINSLQELLHSSRDPELIRIISEMQQHLYSADQSSELKLDGEKIYQLLLKHPFDKQQTKRQDSLPPLYPE